jgi:hypothetical protein
LPSGDRTVAEVKRIQLHVSIRASFLALLLVPLLAACGGVSHARAAKPQPRPFIFSGWRTDVSRHLVPLSQFRSGGPGKDGIPALDHPRFAPARAIRFLRPREPLIELTVRGQTRGYPLQILIWHEIANDRIRGVPVTVTFCPLCNTAIAFDRRVAGRTLDFGTTGNLRFSDLVMYDRQSESWWQQFSGQALVGHYAGVSLRRFPVRIVSWQDFRTSHPDGLVLTRNTGFSRPYGQNPYTGYDSVDSPPYFPVRNSSDRRLPPKARVVYIEEGRTSVAISESLLARRKAMRVDVGGHRLLVRVTGTAASALDNATIAAGRSLVTAAVTEAGRPVPFSEPFWFAVAAFRAHVRLIR